MYYSTERDVKVRKVSSFSYLYLTFSSTSVLGSCVMKVTRSSMHCGLSRKSTSLWFWALHSCKTSSSSITSVNVTSSFSNSVSIWDVVWRSNFQNMLNSKKKKLLCKCHQHVIKINTKQLFHHIMTKLINESLPGPSSYL